MAQLFYLLDGVTTTGPGPPVKMGLSRIQTVGAIPLVLTGVSGDTVILEATNDSDQKVMNDTANWAPIEQATWTADIADGLFTAFAWIRANVVAYNAGNIIFTAII